MVHIIRMRNACVGGVKSGHQVGVCITWGSTLLSFTKVFQILGATQKLLSWRGKKLTKVGLATLWVIGVDIASHTHFLSSHKWDFSAGLPQCWYSV
jgi:hypothetical protein